WRGRLAPRATPRRRLPADARLARASARRSLRAPPRRAGRPSGSAASSRRPRSRGRGTARRAARGARTAARRALPERRAAAGGPDDARGTPRLSRPVARRQGAPRSRPLPDVYEATLDGGRGGHLRGDQVGAPATALAALEVAVGRRGAALAWLEDVGVHAQAHRASRHAPVEAGVAKDLVEALGF